MTHIALCVHWVWVWGPVPVGVVGVVSGRRGALGYVYHRTDVTATTYEEAQLFCCAPTSKYGIRRLVKCLREVRGVRKVGDPYPSLILPPMKKRDGVQVSCRRPLTRIPIQRKSVLFFWSSFYVFFSFSLSQA
jgi:hypothetical protein